MNNPGAATIATVRREFARAAVAAAAVTIFVDLLQLSVPLYMMQVFDRVLASRSIETLTMLMAITLIAVVMFAVLDFLRGRIFIMASHVVASGLNGPAVAAAITETLRGNATTANQALRDIGDLRSFLSGSSIMVPLEIMIAPVFLLVLFLLHPFYGLIAVGASVALLVLSVLNEVLTRKPILEANQATAKSYGAIGGAVRNGEVLEAMGMTDAVGRRWQRSQRHAIAQTIRGTDRGKLLASVSKAVRLALQVVMIATGAIVVINHSASPGSMFAATIIMTRALLPFEHLIDGYRQWVSAYAAYQRLNELLLRTDSRRHGMAIPTPVPRLTVERLVFVPPGHDRAVIKGISFQVEPGEVLGIIGPSGSGKSTLARLLVGVWEPTAGGIYLDGHNVYTWSREDFGRHVGYLPQSVGLLDGTVHENIARMRDVDSSEVIEAARRAGVHEMIGRFPYGYETTIEDTNFALSGGQRQRIGLARALLGRPRLIVLDEPNSNLDQAGEQALIASIKAAKADGSTVVIVAHRPSVLAVADKLLAMRDGMIEHFGPREEVARFGALPARPAAVQIASAPAGGAGKQAREA